MKYALLIYAVPGASENPGPAPEGVVEDWLDYTAAIKEAGVLLGAEQLTWPDTATTRPAGSDGERLLTDGPFIETKEHLLGFYLLEAGRPGRGAGLGGQDAASCVTAPWRCGRVREGMPWQTSPDGVTAAAAGTRLPGGVDRRGRDPVPAARRPAGRRGRGGRGVHRRGRRPGARDGVPPNPGAWLTVTAWRKAVDQLRRDRPVARHGLDAAALADRRPGQSTQSRRAR